MKLFYSKYSNNFYVALICCLLSACAVPKPVLRMKPVEKETQFFMGKEFITHIKDGVMMSLAFERNEGEQFVMDVEFINQSQERILIDPAKFFYQFYDSTNRLNPTVQKVKAIDPEQKILQTEKAMSQAIADSKNERAFLIGTAIVATAAAVAIASSPTKEERKTSNERNYNTIQHQRINKVQTANAMIDVAHISAQGAVNSKIEEQFNTQNLQVLRENWERLPLRKTHLYPTESIQGKIIFNKISKNGYLMFYFPIDTIRHEFLFKQFLHEVKRY